MNDKNLKYDLGVEIAATVRYSETDQMGVVYHANYFVWFNIARDELARRLGIDIGLGEKQGYLMPVIEASCKYLSPARYGDEILVRAVPESSTIAKFIVHYEVVNGRNKKMLAAGKTVSVLMTREGKLVIRAPRE